MVDLFIKKDEAIEVNFASGQALRVPLDDNSRISPEAAHFVPELGGPIAVW